MVSELEKKIRGLDNEKERIYRASRRISKELNISAETAHHYLLAKRQGFESLWQYSNEMSKRKGFKNLGEYQDFIAQRDGFLSRNEYVLYLYYRKKGIFLDPQDFQEREGLSPNLTYLDPFYLDSLPSNKNSSDPFIFEKKEKEEKISFILRAIMKKLPKEHRLVIKKRFFEGKFLEQIASEMNKKSKQAIGYIEVNALKKLYYLAKSSGLYDLYVEHY